MPVSLLAAVNDRKPLSRSGQRSPLAKTPLKVGMISLGCAKNLVDAEIMLGSVIERGMQVTADSADADVLVVNTCAFIDSAKEESIDAIMEAQQQRGLAKRPGQRLIVSGCMAQRFSKELRESLPEVDAFIGLDRTPEFSKFKARQWLVTVALLPKTDTGLTASGGLSRKSLANPIRFTTWALSGPGAQIDDKATRSVGVNFNFKSGDLMTDGTLQCPPDYPSIHVLAQYLGVGNWLFRSAEAMSVADSLSIDKPVYNTEITIKLSANGTYTYTFPPGTNLAAFAGSYSLDEQLNISMAPIADKQTLSVTSLPSSRQYTRPVTSTLQIEPAQNRLDLQGIETALRKLQTQ